MLQGYLNECPDQLFDIAVANWTLPEFAVVAVFNLVALSAHALYPVHQINHGVMISANPLCGLCSNRWHTHISLGNLLRCGTRADMVARGMVWRLTLIPDYFRRVLSVSMAPFAVKLSVAAFDGGAPPEGTGRVEVV